MAAIEIDTEINNYINENNLSIVVIESYQGITQTKGCNSGLTDINPYYLVLDIETNEQFILMEINENIYTKLSLESFYVKMVILHLILMDYKFIYTNI